MPHRRRFWIVGLITALAIGVPAVGLSAGPGKGKNVTSKATQGSGEDSHVKGARGANTPESSIAAPPRKGGPKTNSVPGWVDVDNRTWLWIDVYRNGDYVGTVGPWGDIYVWCFAGDALYARADFPDGTYRFWGPQEAWTGMDWWRLYP